MAVFTAIGSAGATASGLAYNAIDKAMQGEPQPRKFGVQGTQQGGDASS